MREELAETALLLSDPGRAAIVMALLGNIALPAGQLAIIANVAPQTASGHLAKLVSGRILAVEQQGRHRYYRLANAEVAHAIEALLAITSTRSNGSGNPKDIASKNGPRGALAYARTCYSHLAGRLAVEMAAVFEKREYLRRADEKGFVVTTKGREWLEELGVEVAESHWDQPQFVRPCLDWSERRHHIAGKLGAELLARFRGLKWIAPVRGSRAVRVTIQGQEKFQRLLGIRVPNGGMGMSTGEVRQSA
jgi:DNA-binding transcriptional ArsR family regulator